MGAPFGRELFRWRVLGFGQAFVKTPAHSDWNEFMLARPEIQIALNPVLQDIAREMAAKGPSGNEWLGGYHKFSRDITGVRLNELESMRLTLHGCHRIEIRPAQQRPFDVRVVERAEQRGERGGDAHARRPAR